MDPVSRARSAGNTPALTSGAYKFNNGDGVHEADVTQPPNWFKINGQEVQSISPTAPPPTGANPLGKWIMTSFDPTYAKFEHFRSSIAGSRRRRSRPSRKYKKSKRVFRKKSRSTRRR
jgi:hypothetical protein